MRKSVVLGGGATLATILAASSALAGGYQPNGYGMSPYRPGPAGQCGPSGCGTPGPVGYGPGQATEEAYPPNAAPGQCFTKVLVPEVTETVTEQVLVSPEKTESKILPPECRMEDKSILVKEASVQYVTVPASYRTITETVVVRPAGANIEVIPAVYDTVTEQVLVKEGYSSWRPGATVAGYAPGSAPTYNGGHPGVGEGPYGNYPTRVLPTGEVLCLVQIPPEYKTITKQVLRVPARTVEVPYPPETKVITRQVVDQPARVDKVEIPPVYSNVPIKVCGAPQTQSYTVPPVYNTLTEIKVVSPSKFEWKQVDCKTDVVHGDYAPPPAAYIPPAPPPVYEEPPHPIHHHPVRTYAPPPVYVAPPKVAYAPPVVHHKPGYCHTTTTCDGDAGAAPVAPMAPASYAPPAAYAPPAPPPVSLAPAYNGGRGDNAVMHLQAALATKGYYAGPQNGLFTQDTMHAMVKFQRDNHLSEGRYTGDTARALGIG